MQISWQIPEQYLHDQGFYKKKWMIHKELYKTENGHSDIPRYEKYENEFKYQRRSAVVQMRAASRRILLPT